MLHGAHIIYPHHVTPSMAVMVVLTFYVESLTVRGMMAWKTGGLLLDTPSRYNDHDRVLVSRPGFHPPLLACFDGLLPAFRR